MELPAFADVKNGLATQRMHYCHQYFDGANARDFAVRMIVIMIETLRLSLSVILAKLIFLNKTALYCYREKEKKEIYCYTEDKGKVSE